MLSRLLQTLGVVFVLVLVAGAIVGFAVVKDRVHVVIAADDPAAGPDPAALLRDDVQTLARDVTALQQALASNFERLAEGLEQRHAARHTEVLTLQQELAALVPTVTALGQQVAAMQAQVQAQLQALPAQFVALERPRAATPEAPGAPTESGPVMPNAAAPADPASLGSRLELGSAPPAVADAALARVPGAPANGQGHLPQAQVPQAQVPQAHGAQTQSGAAANGPGTGAPAKSGFLSFTVPTAPFRFDVPQDYTLLAELCRVGFDAKSTLHDFTGVTSQVHGAFRADFDDPAGAWTGEVVVQAASLATGVEGRDASMREHLDTQRHPEVRFAVERFEPAKDGIDAAKMVARGDIVGTMTIRGQSKPFRMPITAEVDPQKRVVLTGQAPLKLGDFGVPVPSQLGVIKMQDEVVVWIALRARAAAGGRK